MCAVNADARILAIDQGTTSTRAMVFDAAGQVLVQAQHELPQIYPQDGWVEHNAEEIWRATVEVCATVIEQIGPETVTAMGITNQRETAVIWDRDTGAPIHNAIVWQDRRTASMCRSIRERGLEAEIAARTGLVVDPYFSATKISWLLDNVQGARAAAEAGRLAFGTIDSFLLWRLTGGKVHASDATNAARTQLFDIHAQVWNDSLLEIFQVPRALLPEVHDCAGEFGVCDPALFGRAIPITGIAGDQHAALVGQACLHPGMVKSTYGTGGFSMLNTGGKAVPSDNRLLTTVAYRLNGKTTYALEGSIFVAGAAIQWLRDGLGLIDQSPQSEDHARAVAGTEGVYMVPAFTGLGAPYWDADARGAIVGLSRDTGVSHIVRAALEAVCFQTLDLFQAKAADGVVLDTVRVDGGMAENDWLMQFLADILDLRVERPAMTETTALGVANLAALGAGVFSSLDDVSTRWRSDRDFEPAMAAEDREQLYAGWQKAVERVRG
ncbi:MAG: glycerol kinase GlpK [Rhodospirillaceae bacterium]|jgi:glycerol kinase|nr:glycerol kinase GlpK [Rhodospirillaceae bacterium]